MSSKVAKTENISITLSKGAQQDLLEIVSDASLLSRSNLETLADKIIGLYSKHVELRMLLGIKLGSLSRNANIIALMAEAISTELLIPIGTIKSALQNHKLYDLIMSINIEYKLNSVKGFKNLDEESRESMYILTGSTKTKSEKYMTEDGREVRESMAYKMDPRLLNSSVSGSSVPVGHEFAEQLQLPLDMPEICLDGSIDEFELIVARKKNKIERNLTISQRNVLNRFRNSKRRNHILDGCVRAGKSYVATYIALLEIEDHINNGRSGQIVFIGVSATSCYTNIFKGIIDELFGVNIPSPNAFVWKVKNLNIRIMGSTKTSMNALRGITANRIFIDEANNVITDEYSLTSIKSRMAKDGTKMLMTCNTSSPTHILYSTYLKDASKYEDLSLERYHFDIPTEIANGHPHISKDFYKEYLSLFGEDSTTFKREMLGQWVCADESIYNIDENKHIFIDRDEGIDYSKYDNFYIGMDQGTNSPRVYILLGTFVSNETGETHIRAIKELYYETGHGRIKSYQDYIDELKAFIAPVEDKLRAIYTPHDANDAKLLMMANNYPAMMCNRKVSVHEGIRMIQNILGSGQFKISSRCKWLIREMMEYKYEVKDGQTTEIISKMNDHAPDALRYAITSCGIYCKSEEERYDLLANVDN